MLLKRQNTPPIVIPAGGKALAFVRAGICCVNNSEPTSLWVH